MKSKMKHFASIKLGKAQSFVKDKRLSGLKLKIENARHAVVLSLNLNLMKVEEFEWVIYQSITTGRR